MLQVALVRVDQKLPKTQLQLGQVSGLHGVQGWVKVFSETQPRENIFSYSPWHIYVSGEMRQVEVLRWRKQGKTLVAKLKGLDDRDAAKALIGVKIVIEKDQLPSLSNHEYYWHQLVGLTVFTRYQDLNQELGKVVELMETGANDVLMVQSETREHLVPWVFGEFVLDVDLEGGRIDVDWDPGF